MGKYILTIGIALILLGSLFSPLLAEWKYNPYTGKQDYYEAGASAGYLTDASSDGKTYGRKDGAWAEVTSSPSSASSRSFIITNPTSSSDGPVWRTPGNITITSIHGVEFGGTNIIGMITNCDSNGANCSPINSTDITITTSNVNAAQLTSGNIAAGNYAGWNTTSVSGTVTKAIITFDYTVD